MSYAKMAMHNGAPAVMINDVAYPPMAMTTRIKKPSYLRALGESGLKVFFLMTNTRWLRPGVTETDRQGNVHQVEPSGIEAFVQAAEGLLAEVPDAYIIVRIGMHPPVDWIESHMDEVMKYNDGTHKRAILASEVHRDELPGMYSLGSDAWRRDGTAALQEFCHDVDRLPFADRVIGYFLAAGGTSEWYPINPLEDWQTGQYADFSPAFQREYQRILTDKYQNDAVLQAAWNDSTASLREPRIPTLAERAHVRADQTILDAMLYMESADRIIGKSIDLNARGQHNLGVFLNANTTSITADFYHAWHRATANTIIHFAEVIKKHDSGKLVGAFYGSYGCTDFYQSSTAQATIPILDSGMVDFLAAPGVYNNREPGGYVAQREMQDSMRLRNMIYVVEEDSRTHLENDFYRDAMGLYTITDTIDTLKRDFARNICEDIFAWWFDQHLDSGRYMHKDIYQLFAQQQDIAQMAYRLNRRKNNEIALIYDQESLHYVSSGTNALMLDFYRTSDLARIGAPVDYYFHDDMARNDMPDYKMYVMMNLFALTDREREDIHRKAARNGAVVVWLYAPGFINPEREHKMDNQYITELTGFGVGRKDETTSPRFRLEGAHPAASFGRLDRKYGFIDRDVHSNVWLGNVLPVPFANPFFYIDDMDAEILGRFLINGLPAYGIKRYKGFTSVYCAAQILRSELLASLAAYAGCHLFLYGDDCLYTNENFVTVHAASEGSRTIHFKQPCSPYEVYEGRYYGNNVSQITIPMRLGETLMFCTQPEDAWVKERQRAT